MARESTVGDNRSHGDRATDTRRAARRALKVYLESSAALAIWLGEESAPAVLAELAEAELVVASDLTRIECERTLHREAQLGRLGADQARTARQRSQRFWTGCGWLTFEARVCRRAEEAFPVEPIRTLDALHVAFLEQARRAFGDVGMLSLDARVRGCTEAMKLPVLPQMRR